MKKILFVLLALTLCATFLTACKKDEPDTEDNPVVDNQPSGDNNPSDDNQNDENLCKDGHSYGEWVETVAATCTEAGEERRYCKNCNHFEARDVAELGHDIVHYDAKAPTCIEIGWNAYDECSFGDYTTYAEILATGHNYVDKVCSKCGEPKTSEGLEFFSNGDGTCYVSGIGTCTDTDIVIPTTSPDGDRVTAIGGSAFRMNIDVTSVTIPDGVTKIGRETFYICESLTSVKIPDSVTSIGNRAFAYCDSLLSVKIPDSVTSIGEETFYKCTSLTSVLVGNSLISIGNGAFASCFDLARITVDENNPNYKSIDGNLYTKDGGILLQYAIGKTETSFTIPNGVTSIGYNAFYGCKNLTNVTVPDSATSIGDGAFEGCTSLIVIEIPNGVTSIGKWAFRDCESLASIVIPVNVTSVADWVFSGCKSLRSIKIPDSVTSIGTFALSDCTGLTSISIGKGVISIFSYAFSGCESLTNVYYSGSEEDWAGIVIGNNDNLTGANITYNYEG